jgi:hypothetical protein
VPVPIVKVLLPDIVNVPLVVRLAERVVRAFRFVRVPLNVAANVAGTDPDPLAVTSPVRAVIPDVGAFAGYQFDPDAFHVRICFEVGVVEATGNVPIRVAFTFVI